MCTYLTVTTDISGSGKGPAEWITLNRATVYFDHPQRTVAEHTLNIDFVDATAGPGARVAVELTAAAARDLVAAINSALAAAEPSIQAPQGAVQ